MKSKLIIITGASSGIGATLANTFSAAGYSLGLLARNIEAMQELALPNAFCVVCDVSDFGNFKNAIHQVEHHFNLAVDCLINNAGFCVGGEFTTVSHTAHQNTIAVNTMGVINGMEIVLPKMQQFKSGTIINISSVADRNSRPQLATYAASKAAVKSLTESLRAANAKYGIRICNIAPAKIATPMMISSTLGMAEAIDASEVAKLALMIYQLPQSVCIRDIVIAPTGYEA